jgi:hypothetical protein
MSLYKKFPHLIVSGYTIESPRTRQYNCIAWAANRNDKWWWPGAPGPPYFYYWPPGVPRRLSIRCFVLAFATLGYEPCGKDDKYEIGYEKVALYADENDVPKHMARQVERGSWVSNWVLMSTSNMLRCMRWKVMNMAEWL